MDNNIELSHIEEIKKLLDDCNINIENIGNKVKLFIKENGPSLISLKTLKYIIQMKLVKLMNHI